jgi:hypothetical protein
MGLEEAILTACPIRLRPFLMTSLACIAGAVPLAIGAGAGAETRAPLARSIIGGMFLSTLVTLVIVPIYYILFDRFAAYVRKLARREPEEHSPTQQPHFVYREKVHTNGELGVAEAKPELGSRISLISRVIPSCLMTSRFEVTRCVFVSR